MSSRFRIYNFLVLLALIASCKPAPVSHWFPVTPQEHYERDLLKNKLDKTAAGQTWFREAKAVLTDSLYALAPYQERFFLGDSIPAQSIRLKIPEGRKLIITPTRGETDSAAHLFIELFKIRSNGKTQRLDYLAEGAQQLEYINYDQDTLLLKMQTGLNENMAVTISLSTEPTLAFPVANHSMKDLISFWGADRDGGIRSHEGVDIKARRGTPVVASQNGFVTNAGTNNLGGKVVFLSSLNSPYSLYYAHLDSQLVSAGTRVIIGDTLGLVGNTGNAITTAPHLHFGIYTRGKGAVNPLAFIDDRKEKIPGLPEMSMHFGDTAVIRKKANLYLSASFGKTELLNNLAANTPLRVIGEMSKGFRVALPDGTIGYIPAVPLKKYQPELSVAP